MKHIPVGLARAIVDDDDFEMVSKYRWSLPASHPQNHGNSEYHSARKTSVYKGVGFMRCAGKWRARTRKIVDGKIVENHIGLFESEEEAACAYDEAARAYFGDYALTNKDLALIPTSPTEVIKAVKEIQR